MQICVFEDPKVDHLEPLTSTRPVFDLRLGRQTLLERLGDRLDFDAPMLQVRRQMADLTASMHPESAVNADLAPGGSVLFLNGRWPAFDNEVAVQIRELALTRAPATVFIKDDSVIAAWIPDLRSITLPEGVIDRTVFDGAERRTADGARLVSRMWHLIEMLPDMLIEDGQDILDDRAPQIDREKMARKGVVLGMPENIRCAASTDVKLGALLNAEYGPIVVDEHATIMEGAVLRGPLYIGPHSQIRPGARIDTSAVGAHSHVGGEVSHSIIHSYSNKVHDGFLGSSYVGKWCNLAADSNTSTLKNDYSPVSLYNSTLETFEPTDKQHLGLFMGDHSKCGINSMFNPGTVVGVSCNLFGSGYMPRFACSFSWGHPDALSPYRLEKAQKVADAVTARRDGRFTDAERRLLAAIHARTHA